MTVPSRSTQKQNTRRNLAESIHKLYASGLYVTAGFIVGFDSERASIADAMLSLIEEAAIPVCMVGLLYALPNTQLTRRLAQEGRLHPFVEGTHRGSADQCSQGLNFETLRPRREILADYKRVLEHAYEPAAYLGRLRRMATLLDNSRRAEHLHPGDARNRFTATQMLHRLIANLPEPRDEFWQTIVQCAARNPSSARYVVTMMAFYLHWARSRVTSSSASRSALPSSIAPWRCMPPPRSLWRRATALSGEDRPIYVHQQALSRRAHDDTAICTASYGRKLVVARRVRRRIVGLRRLHSSSEGVIRRDRQCV